MVSVFVEQQAENPVRLQIGRDIKDETNSDQKTVTQNQGDREQFGGREFPQALAIESRQKRPRSQHHAETGEAGKGQGVRLIAEQRF